jgi:hypothetical protein
MAYSDLNYVSPKLVKHIFGLSEGKYTMLAVNGSFKFKRMYKNPLILMDSLASMYNDREGLVLKRWGYDYETPKEKYEKMMSTLIKGYPRCFFRVNDIPEAYYRAFYKGRALKICVFIIEGYARCVCFSRDYESDLELFYDMYDSGNVEVEG